MRLHEDFSPGEPATLLEDLLEDSDRLYHKHMAMFQINQQVAKQNNKIQLSDWAKEEVKKGGVKSQVRDLVADGWQSLLRYLRDHRDEYRTQLAIEKETRDHAIRIFCNTHDAAEEQPS